MADEILVAAASDLRPPFEELGSLFTEETGTEVTFSFGSSGQLREQILNGAPFHLFASANVDYVDAVIAAGRGRPDSKAYYATGRLALIARPGLEAPETVQDVSGVEDRRLSIANPEHAPYGLAARQALQAAGVYDEVEHRLVYGENVSDALRIVSTGAADVGIVALSLAIAEGIDHHVVPAELHGALRQALVVTRTGPGPGRRAAQAFAELLSSPAGHDVMTRYGFDSTLRGR